MKKKIIVLFLVLFKILAFGQYDEKVMKAFSKSYDFEQYKDYKGAIAVLDNVYLSTSYEINLRLGWLHYLKGDFTKSISFYNKASQLKPKSIEALLGVVYPLGSTQNSELIINAYQKIITLDSNNFTANYKLANIYYINKKFVLAEKHLQKILPNYPFSYNCLILMGKIKVSLGKIVEAKEMYYRSLLYNPKDNVAKDGFRSVK